MNPVSDTLWAVTSYFNPVGYRRRRENFRVFRERLSVPLVAVELSFNGRFELGPGDAEVLIQIHGQDVMWQKERLLNVAVQALPAACTKAAILDCDVLFVRPDWVDALSERLDQVAIVQPFSTVHYIPRDLSPDCPVALAGNFTRPAAAVLIEQGESSKNVLGNFTGRYPGSPAPGHAVAVRRELLDKHGLYDACIVGGGDRALLAGASGGFEEVTEAYAMNRPQQVHFLTWAEQLREAARGEIGCVPGDLIHLWHGEMSDRRTPERYFEFARFNFNPYEDIAVDLCGYWRWNSDKPAMHAYLHEYFVARNEDGLQAAHDHRYLREGRAAGRGNVAA